ncbi:hypothetical protein [Nostoc sp.]|uniref:hypothetical protein n=1 Tax=Nostoc sp. TaxID=1180 RepID=UPI002FFB4A53
MNYYLRSLALTIDAAICEYKTFDISGYQKLDEVPYDFNRKRLSILFKQESTHLTIAKGAQP